MGVRGWLVRYVRVLLVVGALWWGVWGCGLAIDTEGRQHFLGRSEQAVVDVLEVREVDGDCGRRDERYRTTYRRVGEEAVATNEDCRSRAPDLGRQQAWLAGDELELDSPTSQRLWALVTPFLFAGAVTWHRSRSSD